MVVPFDDIFSWFHECPECGRTFVPIEEETLDFVAFEIDQTWFLLCSKCSKEYSEKWNPPIVGDLV